MRLKQSAGSALAMPEPDYCCPPERLRGSTAVGPHLHPLLALMGRACKQDQMGRACKQDQRSLLCCCNGTQNNTFALISDGQSERLRCETWVFRLRATPAITAVPTNPSWSTRSVSVRSIVGDSDYDLRLIEAMHEFFNFFWLHRHSGKTAQGKRKADYQRPQQVLDRHKISPRTRLRRRM